MEEELPAQPLRDAAEGIELTPTPPGESSLGQLKKILTDKGFSGALAERLTESSQAVLADIERFSNEGPDDEVARRVLASEIRQLEEDGRLSERLEVRKRGLRLTCDKRWQSEPISRTIFAKSRGKPREYRTYTESSEDVQNRLATNIEQKRNWDEQVARTKHRNPARVAAHLVLREKGHLADRLTEIMEEIIVESSLIRPIEEEHRDLNFWTGLAGIAFERVLRDDVKQIQRKDEALMGAVALLRRKKLRQNRELFAPHEEILRSRLLKPEAKVKLLEAKSLKREAVEVGEALRGQNITRVETQEKGAQGLVVDGRRLKGKTSMNELLILRALTGKPPKTEEELRSAVAV